MLVLYFNSLQTLYKTLPFSGSLLCIREWVNMEGGKRAHAREHVFAHCCCFYEDQAEAGTHKHTTTTQKSRVQAGSQMLSYLSWFP
jgi:hypothetical protein